MIKRYHLQHHCMEKQWCCADKYYHKGIWYTETFSSQLLRGCNKNQFFHFFGLLHNMLRHHHLPNNWFERRLKLSSQCSSPFLEKLFHQVSFIVRIPNVTLKWLWKFWLSIISISCLWVEPLSGVFFQQLLLKIQNHIHQ